MDSGRARITASKIMLGTCMPMKKTRKEMQCPERVGSQDLAIGMHWKAPRRLLTRSHKTTNIPTINVVFRKLLVENMRR